MKLNLGCGRDVREGYVNLDFVPHPGVDVLHNLDLLPLPFEDNTFDEVLMMDILEHIPHRVNETTGEFFLPFINELIRISKNNAKWTVESPRHPIGLRSSCHTRIISPVSFEPWTTEEMSLESFVCPPALQLERIQRLWNFNIWDWSRFGKCMRNRLTLRVVKG